MVHLQVILKEREEKKRIRLLDESSYLSSGGIIDDDDVTTNDPDCDVEESPDLSQEGQCSQLAGACSSGATLTYMLSEGVQMDFAMCKMQRALQKRVSSLKCAFLSCLKLMTKQ